ncbi:RES family NAD+ phosphorylase [Bradyrhizobium sp. 17]|uniref:RES family NAD+ phosphorylase n=1 Tax=Bradyrhizobium sp. 17 TaxID=2782649 RepID=UPI001FF72567|nr:RES family NAD+ phosphorylase [Bradyrhizobium sp. 17]
MLNVARLVSVPSRNLNAILVSRGIPLEDLDAVEAALLAVGPVITAADAIRFTFARTPIPPQRFNTAHFPALYTAVDEPTCLAEIKHHLRFAVTEQRYYQFLHVTFTGSTLVTAGHEEEHTDLVSPTEAGYTYCRALATEARAAGNDALYASSARNPGGICVPIFSEPALSAASITTTVRFSFDGANVQHQLLP